MIEKAPIFCHECRRDVTNGIGPADMPEVTKFLHRLPSSHMFYESANWHDLNYHLGKTEDDRKKADDYFLKCMLYDIKVYCNFYSKPWYRLQAYRNYYAVRWLGKAFFNYEGCKK